MGMSRHVEDVVKKCVFSLFRKVIVHLTAVCEIKSNYGHLCVYHNSHCDIQTRSHAACSYSYCSAVESETENSFASASVCIMP